MYRYIHPTAGPQSISQWLEVMLKPSHFQGEELLSIQSSGTVKKVARKFCGLLFKGLKKPSIHGAEPVAIVNIQETFERALVAGHVIVPIGDMGYPDYHTTCVLKQCARQWFGGDIDMNDTNILRMYYSAIQSLLITLVQSKTLEDLTTWTIPLLGMVRALKKLHYDLPDAKKVAETFRIVPSLDNSLQKALAHSIAGTPVTLEDQIRMLESILRHTLRTKSEFTAVSPGPIAVFLACPLLSYLPDDVPFEKLVKLFVADFNQAMERYVDALPTPNIYVRKEIRCIVALTRTAFEKALTYEQVEACLASLKADPTAEVPWTGVLPAPQDLVPQIFCGPFVGKGARVVTRACVVKPESPTRFFAAGSKGTEWTGLQLLTAGIYTVDLFPLETPPLSIGEDRKANFRCTLGNDILTLQEHSYSLAGMLQMRNDGAWELRHAEPLDIRQPVQIMITQHEMQLTQHGTLFARFLRLGKPVLLAFRNLLLSVSFEEMFAPPVPVPTPSAFARLSEES